MYKNSNLFTQEISINMKKIDKTNEFRWRNTQKNKV